MCFSEMIGIRRGRRMAPPRRRKSPHPTKGPPVWSQMVSSIPTGTKLWRTLMTWTSMKGCLGVSTPMVSRSHQPFSRGLLCPVSRDMMSLPKLSPVPERQPHSPFPSCSKLIHLASSARLWSWPRLVSWCNRLPRYAQSWYFISVFVVCEL